MNPSEVGIQEKRIADAMRRLQRRVIAESIPLDARVWNCGEPVAFADRLKGDYAPIREGAAWGRNWESAWFRLTGTVPAEWAGRHVIAWLRIGAEGLVFRPDGSALQGITNYSVHHEDTVRDRVDLFTAAAGGEAVELWLEGACNGLFGITPEAGRDTSKDDPRRYGEWVGTAERLRLACFDKAAWQLHLDMEVLFDLHHSLPRQSVRRARILRALHRAVNVLHSRGDAIDAAAQELNEVLAKPASASSIPVRAVGHAHIDTGWLWPVSETVRKCARTFSSQLRLIETYPDYVFGHSAPQHYLFMKEHYPELYARIRQAVAAGRWEVQGGMWIEADCNVPGGESLVRQFLHGKNFWMKEFGIDVTNLWIPDVFGYSAALPQIMARSAVDTFLTQKMSWNKYNRMPHHTFLWQGIDGTRILTHFPPEDTYNSTLQPGSLNAAQERFEERDRVDEVMCLFGIGDGGGGPTDTHIERGLRQADLEGSPPVRFGMAKDFFAALHSQRDALDVWSGELYLELHRGTLTTQAWVKKCNRLLEYRLRALELLWTCVPLSEYPRGEFDAIWKTVLLNQFHDILPGSSIRKVYETTHADYARATASCDTLQDRLAEALFEPHGSSMTLVNTLPHPWRGAVALPEGWVGAAGVPSQADERGGLAYVEIQALSSVVLERSDSTARAGRDEGLVLENDVVRYTFAYDGTLIGAFDKEADRDVLRRPGNILGLYADWPHDWDAWEIDRSYEEEWIENAEVADIGITANGPVRTTLTISARVGTSTIHQRVHLATGTKRLDFETEVEWNEKHRMLRVSFLPDVNAEEASCDIQFGYVHRPTHSNTSWDLARFEVCAHTFIDISEPDFGVALLNDCKYGHKVQGNVLELNLLRSPTWPDPDADEGHHTFTYSLLPHIGDLVRGPVQREAACLNQLPVVFAGSRGSIDVPVRLEGDHVSLAALKKAESEECLIARIVETAGCRGTARLHVRRGSRVVETNLLEWTEDRDVEAADGVATIPLKPFEIRTFKIVSPAS